MVGSQRHVQSRSKEDVIDRFFTFFEAKVCSDIPVSEEPDRLDDVFEKVESFACRGDDGVVPTDSSDIQPRMLNRDNSMMDNSLIEACNSVSSKWKQKSFRAPTLKPVGEKGDIVDVVFGQVESYTCGETGELDFVPQQPRGSHRVSAANSIVADDEVQLYYRPESA